MFAGSTLQILAVPSTEPVMRFLPLGENSQKWTVLECLLNDPFEVATLFICCFLKAEISSYHTKTSPLSLPAAIRPSLFTDTDSIFLFLATPYL
jgi:hypothetical protein